MNTKFLVDIFNLYNTILNKYGVFDLYVNSIAKNRSGEFISLYNHTYHVVNEAINYVEKREKTIIKIHKLLNLNYNRYDIKSNEFIYKLIETIVLHDYGKTDDRWQRAIKSGDFNGLNYRHEIGVLSNLFIRDNVTISNNLPLIISILSHHSNLSHNDELLNKFDLYGGFDILSKNNFSNIETIVSSEGYKSISKYLKGNFSSIEIKDPDKFFLEVELYRHILHFADKRASGYEDYQSITEITKIEHTLYSFDNNWSKRNLQKIAENNTSDMFILRSPTGSGKTTAALLWANNKIKSCERFIICMPTQYTSNSLYNDLYNNIGICTKDFNLVHSGNKVKSSYNNILFSKTFESIINVSTIDQVLNAINLATDVYKSRFLNIINSCVIIDEIDFYDDFVLGNIIKLLVKMKKYNVPVMMMSATTPNSFIKLLSDNNIEVDFVDDESDLDRVRVRIQKIVDNDIDTFKILDKVINRDSLIVYANTVSQAKKYYNYIKRTSNRDDVVLYHSEFCKSDKLSKEDRIKNMLGKDGVGKGIVIMTQIGELSINISSDTMVSEFAPIDRLIQRFGRGCRFNSNICEVFLIKPTKDGELYPAPYGVYDLKDKWVANKNLLKTIDILKIGYYSGRDYLNIINNVYDKIDISSKAKNNSKLLINNFVNNVMFNSKSNIDDTATDKIKQNEWRSRDIDNQICVIISDDIKDKYNYIDYSYLYDNRSISLSEFRFNQIKKSGIIFDVEAKIVYDESNTTNTKIYYTNSYDSDIGIIDVRASNII